MREENVKHFRLSNGTFMAAVYDEPVHYFDKQEKCFKEYGSGFNFMQNFGSFAARFFLQYDVFGDKPAFLPCLFFRCFCDCNFSTSYWRKKRAAKLPKFCMKLTVCGKKT